MSRQPLRTPLRKQAANDDTLAEKDDTLIMDMRLQSGRFHSSIRVPLFGTKKEKMEFIDTWLHLMETGLKIGQSPRDE